MWVLEEPILFWYWLILGVVFLTLEVLAPGAILMWFGIGAVVTGVILWLFQGMAIGWQILIFAMVSAASVVVWRKSGLFTENKAPPLDPTLNNRLQGHIGKEYTLSKAIANGRGSVKLGDSNWRVSGDEMPKGTRVRVVGTEGITLIVEAI